MLGSKPVDRSDADRTQLSPGQCPSHNPDKCCGGRQRKLNGHEILGGLVSALNGDRDGSETLQEAVAGGTANTLPAGGGQFDVREFKARREQLRKQRW